MFQPSTYMGVLEYIDVIGQISDVGKRFEALFRNLLSSPALFFIFDLIRFHN